MISVEGPVFFDTGEMHSFVKNMGGEQLTLINNESFSFTNSSSKFKPGKWNISVSRTTGFLQVIGLDTSTNVQMVSYEGKCKKAVKKKLF